MSVIDTRTISGHGVLKCPYSNADIKKAKVLTFFVDVIRPPSLYFSNKHYNPNKAFYGTLCFMRDGYVMSALKIEFESQVFEFNADIAAQAEYAIKCAYSGILTSFANLGTALNLTVTSVTNNIKNWTHTVLFPDSVLVVCEADTALQIVCQSTPYDICPDDTSVPPPPPPPPPPPTKYPKGTKFDNPATSPISPPYNPPDDSGETVPYDGDVANNPNPVPPRTCTVRTVTVLWFFNGDPGNGRTTSFQVYGDIGNARNGDLGDGTFALQVFAYGSPVGGGTCLPEPTWVSITSPTGNPNQYGNVSIQSIVPPQ